MSGALADRVACSLDRDIAPEVGHLAEQLARESDALAVLFYGSNLRTGSLTGVLDFYVLLPGPQRERVWPRVSYREWPRDGEPLRAKIATMSLDTFGRAAAGRSHDTTIWARFVQPSSLVWHRDERSLNAVRRAIERAARTAGKLAVALGPPGGTEAEYWRGLFRETYGAEFRVEKSGREGDILAHNAAHFDGLLPAVLYAEAIGFTQAGERLIPQMPARQRKKLRARWRRRKRAAKPLNLLRLLKASTTFEGATRYAAWKIERHTGVPVEVTPWRERHPVLAAPGVLARVWRARRRL